MTGSGTSFSLLSSLTFRRIRGLNCKLGGDACGVEERIAAIDSRNKRPDQRATRQRRRPMPSLPRSHYARQLGEPLACSARLAHSRPAAPSTRRAPAERLLEARVRRILATAKGRDATFRVGASPKLSSLSRKTKGRLGGGRLASRRRGERSLGPD